MAKSKTSAGTYRYPTRRFTADEVQDMVRDGRIGEDEPIQLMAGELVRMAPQGPDHAWIKDFLHDELAVRYAGLGFVRNQVPLHADSSSLPEPDLAVVRGARRDFRLRHPEGAETILVVEVSVTSQAIDRRKASIYARAGVPEYWLLDVPARRVEVCTEPSPDGRYGLIALRRDGETLSLPELDSQLQVADLLP